MNKNVSNVSFFILKTHFREFALIRSENLSAYISLKIKEIRVHERFEPQRIQNDIALIVLQEPITIGKFILKVINEIRVKQKNM